MNNMSDEEVLMNFVRDFRKFLKDFHGFLVHYEDLPDLNCGFKELYNRGLVNTFVEIYTILYGKSYFIHDFLHVLDLNMIANE
jgi:hypothetical protein